MLYFTTYYNYINIDHCLFSENGRKLFVTLHFLYVTMPDDSQYGPYECDAFAVNDPEARKHGFSVTVFRGMIARLHKTYPFYEIWTYSVLNRFHTCLVLHFLQRSHCHEKFFQFHLLLEERNNSYIFFLWSTICNHFSLLAATPFSGRISPKLSKRTHVLLAMPVFLLIEGNNMLFVREDNLTLYLLGVST